MARDLFCSVAVVKLVVTSGALRFTDGDALLLNARRHALLDSPNAVYRRTVHCLEFLLTGTDQETFMKNCVLSTMCNIVVFICSIFMFMEFWFSKPWPPSSDRSQSSPSLPCSALPPQQWYVRLLHNSNKILIAPASLTTCFFIHSESVKNATGDNSKKSSDIVAFLHDFHQTFD